MKRAIIAAGAMSAAAALFFLKVRPWQLRWGATDDEVARPMPGDDWVPLPDYATTKAVTVRARPEDIWPWLAQMGRGRGGLYSFDVLDRLFGVLDAPSAERILPEFQHLAPGDVIPVGKLSGFPVRSVDPNRSLVLAGEERGLRWSWVFGLFEQADGTTRLVTRNRVSAEGRWSKLLMPLELDQPAFIMLVQMLRNLKRRGERPARERSGVSGWRRPRLRRGG